ncbi:NAC domain-containing protein JA2L-like [Tasmannia lanceolata]|uniref:NAC domain-containing protein JA2L-like n=1 Tax=Tasmannia lanceolata TaxID=3420 RepID=UPI004063AAA9
MESGKVPPCYRFTPRDHELFFHYLQKRVHRLSLTYNPIREVNLYDSSPDVLTKNYEPGGENEWYFFTSRQRKYKGGDRPNRTAGHGFWKPRKENMDVIHDGKVYGKKQSLVYYRENKPKATKTNKPKAIKTNKPKATKTNWLMQEYTIPELTKKKKDHPGSNMMLNDCILCKVYQSFRGADKPAKGQPREVEQVAVEGNGYNANESKLDAANQENFSIDHILKGISEEGDIVDGDLHVHGDQSLVHSMPQLHSMPLKRHRLN